MLHTAAHPTTPDRGHWGLGVRQLSREHCELLTGAGAQRQLTRNACQALRARPGCWLRQSAGPAAGTELRGRGGGHPLPCLNHGDVQDDIQLALPPSGVLALHGHNWVSQGAGCLSPGGGLRTQDGDLRA